MYATALSMFSQVSQNGVRTPTACTYAAELSRMLAASTGAPVVSRTSVMNVSGMSPDDNLIRVTSHPPENFSYSTSPSYRSENGDSPRWTT
ncbi:hypothetical protein [Actinoplanes derwentensis]|uniref:Uncharacterized protein n=1 Tax=Actinoplanes derwentensis TaxID=113562 RepID=A0A1H1Z7M5_9ACTN|nr:hypothetical protein [Actinoplanes derwentensis]SDT29216.1 hypothetical protein SAMN04489716_3163 [Actinoplanes derwentensis]